MHPVLLHYLVEKGSIKRNQKRDKGRTNVLHLLAVYIGSHRAGQKLAQLPVTTMEPFSGDLSMKCRAKCTVFIAPFKLTSIAA